MNGYTPRASTRLSAPEIMAEVFEVPAEQFEPIMAAQPPELASRAAVYLAHDSCALNGVVLACGGGQAARLAFSGNDGFRSGAMSPELIADNIDQVVDMSDAQIRVVGSAERHE